MQMTGHHTGSLGAQQQQELFQNESELALIVGEETASHSESVVFRTGRGGRGILNIETPPQTLVDKSS